VSRFYLAAAFGKRFLLQGYRADLCRLGHTVTSRWLDIREEGVGDGYARACAKDDLEDIRLADTLIVFDDNPRSTRGGHAFESGYAYALGKQLIIVGHRTHIFHHLIDCTFSNRGRKRWRCFATRLMLASNKPRLVLDSIDEGVRMLLAEIGGTDAP
jgi:hypothetical protein